MLGNDPTPVLSCVEPTAKAEFRTGELDDLVPEKADDQCTKLSRN